MPAHALAISKTMALVKPKCCLSLIEVLGSKETKPEPSYLEILQQIRRSISVGSYFDFARQSAIAFLAKSMENSFCPAIRLVLMPVIFSSGKLNFIFTISQYFAGGKRLWWKINPHALYDGVLFEIHILFDYDLN